MYRQKNGQLLVSAFVIVVLIVLLTLLLLNWQVIFQRGNPIPYLVAAAQISDQQPYQQVGQDTGLFISKRGECPELLDYVAAQWNLHFVEQAGSGYIFSDGTAFFTVGSEVYLGRYTLWELPLAALQSKGD